MATITLSEIKHIADLAKLELDKKEEEKYFSELDSIIDFVGKLKEVDVKGIEPLSQTTGLVNVKRDDVQLGVNVLTNDEALGGTEEVYNGYFKVPAILEGRTDK